MRTTAIAILILLAATSFAQTVSPSVINAGGSSRSAGGIRLDDNVGEPFTETLGPVGLMMVTQGFLQPATYNGLTILRSHPTCITAENGFIKLIFSTLNQRHTEQYIWTPAMPCPAGNCADSVNNVGPGIYSVTILSTYTTNTGGITTDTIRSGPIEILASSEPCRVTVYSGVTPNGDGVNDKFRITNIEEYPNNVVSIYNRWGTQLFETRGYDNESNSWPSAEMLNKLTSSTYFYIIDLGDGSKPLKGWVELLKN